MLTQDVIKLSGVRPGDVIEAARIRYTVKSITADSSPARGGYNLRLVRVSDGYETLQHSLYIGKEVILISRGLVPVTPRRYFAVDTIESATPTAIRMTWESIKAVMGSNRRVIESSFMSTCECCGGMVRVGQPCLWVKGHVIHLSNQECVNWQADVIRDIAIQQTITTRRANDAICRRARHAGKVTLGTITMFPALLPGPVSLDGCELWASGD